MLRIPVALCTLPLLGSCVFHVERDAPPPDDDAEFLASEDGAGRGPSPFRVGFLVGYRELDDGDLWDPVEDQFAMGAEFVVEPSESPIGWEFGIAASGWTEDEGDVDVKGSLTEIFGGVRKTFGTESVQPYVGAGVSLFAAETRSEEDFKGGERILRDDDGGLGVYWRAGVTWPLGARARLGLDYRAMTGSDVDFFRAEGDADFAQISLVLLTSF